MSKRRNTGGPFPSDHNPACPAHYLKKLAGDLRARYSYGEYPNGEKKNFWYSCDSDGNFVARLTPKGQTDPPPPENNNNSPTESRNASRTEFGSDMTLVKTSELTTITAALRTLIALAEQHNVQHSYMSADIDKLKVWMRDYVVGPSDADYLKEMNNKDAV